MGLRVLRLALEPTGSFPNAAAALAPATASVQLCRVGWSGWLLAVQLLLLLLQFAPPEVQHWWVGVQPLSRLLAAGPLFEALPHAVQLVYVFSLPSVKI